jgi:membrane protease YdiL (CAAX protease family)
MAKKQSSPYMTPGEQIAGVTFFVIYLLVLPFAAEPLLGLVERLFAARFTAAQESMLYYGILSVVTLVIFHKYLGRTTRLLFDRLGEAARTVLLGLVGLYGLNELVYRLSSLVISNRTNLNDTTISAQIQDAPRVTLLIIVFLAPFIEEVLFRGLVFGNLKSKSRVVAYLVSCLLFALLHVWQFAVVQQDITYFLLMVQYLVPGAVLAWAYESSGTLWTSIGLHAVANALSAWAMF